MKKLIVLSALLLTATISFTSCDKKTTDGEPATDATVTATDSTATATEVDTTATATTATTTETAAPAAQDSGKAE